MGGQRMMAMQISPRTQLLALFLFIGVAAGASAQPPSRLQCTPVTPDTKVPWIEVSQLPDLTRDTAYFEACSDLDYAWTTLSYPNAKYVPARTPEHEARVSLLLQGIKKYVSAESDDWVAYVNAWLGATLPLPKTERKVFLDGETIHWTSFVKAQNLMRLETSSEMLWLSGRQYLSSDVTKRTNDRKLSISGLTSDGECRVLAAGSSAYRSHCKMGMASENLCITPVDLKNAFENQPGYLLQPTSVRTARLRPTSQELTKLGGQWFGYQVHVFSGPTTGKYAGLVQFRFEFKPCASSIQIELSESKSAESKQ